MERNSKSSGIGLLVGGIIVFILLKIFGKLLGKILSFIISIGVIILIVFGIMVIISAIKSGGDGDTSEKKTSFNSIMAKGRASVAQLKVLNPSIKASEVREASEKFTAVSEGILSKIRDDEDGILNAMQFINYYLPEVTTLLKKFQKSESAGDCSGETRRKIADNVNEITKAIDAKFNSVVAGTSTAGLDDDIDALIAAFKSDELLSAEKNDELDELEKKYS